jgi:hypothetical protein
LYHLQASLQALDHFRLLHARCLRASLHPVTLAFRMAECNVPVIGTPSLFAGYFG